MEVEVVKRRHQQAHYHRDDPVVLRPVVLSIDGHVAIPCTASLHAVLQVQQRQMPMRRRPARAPDCYYKVVGMEHYCAMWALAAPRIDWLYDGPPLHCTMGRSALQDQSRAARVIVCPPNSTA